LGALRDAVASGLAAHASLADVAATLASRRREAAAVGFTARSRAELIARLDAARAVVAGTPAKGIWFRPAPEAHKVAFLFPGQGAQAVGPGRALCERFPQFRARLAHYAGGLIDYLYPQPPFDHDAATRALTRTEICQPIMAALGLALADFLGTLGLRP